MRNTYGILFAVNSVYIFWIITIIIRTSSKLICSILWSNCFTNYMVDRLMRLNNNFFFVLFQSELCALPNWSKLYRLYIFNHYLLIDYVDDWGICGLSIDGWVLGKMAHMIEESGEMKRSGCGVSVLLPMDKSECIQPRRRRNITEKNTKNICLIASAPPLCLYARSNATANKWFT